MRRTVMRLVFLALIAVCVFYAGLSLRAQDASRNTLIVHVNASLGYESEGKIDSALSEMLAAFTTAKNDYFINLRLGWLEYLSGSYDRSTASYRRANELAEYRSVEAMLGLVLPLAAKGEWGEVESIYLKILALDPAHYLVNLRLGQIYLNRGEYSKAQRFLETALTHYPSEYEVNLSTGWNGIYLGDWNQARECFERVLMISPGDTSALRGISCLK